MSASPRILIAPGPYKECLDSYEVASEMEQGVLEICPDATVVLRPLCDGGSGIARVLAEATGGNLVEVQVSNPLGEPVQAQYAMLGGSKTAVIESAQSAGLALIPVKARNPLKTSTYGVGELILHAISSGAEEIIVGCGDSGTNDAGIGCAAALGARFYTIESNYPIEQPRGEDLLNIARVDFQSAQQKLANVKLTVAGNLASILCGAEGTTHIYARQKGATPEQIAVLASGVESYVEVVREATGLDVSFVPGAGGAGGLASALYICGAKLLYSIDVIDRFLSLDAYLAECDLVLTGEGSIDDRTATGKVACGIALKAKKYNLPVIAIVGSIAIEHEDIFYNGIDAIECITEGPTTLRASMDDARTLIRHATERVMRFLFRIPRVGVGRI